MKITTGRTADRARNKFYERTMNGTQILVQVNSHGVWHGYVGQIHKAEFSGETEAIYWLLNYPMADAG